MYYILHILHAGETICISVHTQIQRQVIQNASECISHKLAAIERFFFVPGEVLVVTLQHTGLWETVGEGD